MLPPSPLNFWAGVPPLAPSTWRHFRLEWGKKTYVMGILNITPDSFSQDGLAHATCSEEEQVATALAQARRFLDEGADMLDVGGESTRPQHIPVSAEEELARVIPVIRALAGELGHVPLSIDTYKVEVARAALEAGATMLNDVWGFQISPAMPQLAAQYKVPVVIMHNQQGTHYTDLLGEIEAMLQRAAGQAREAGVPPEHIIIDPGIGFGKTKEQNLVVLRRLGELRGLGFPLLLGTSRKSTIGAILNLPVDDRVEGTAATVALGIAAGADIVRVHDVREMVRVARMTDAIVRAL